MVLRRLAVGVVAALACSAALVSAAQAPTHEHRGWNDVDKDGQPAPMTFNEFHGRTLLYDRVVEKLTESGCVREEKETFILYTCKADPNRWFLTKPGRTEHPALAIGADEAGGEPAGGHTRPLMETIALNPERPSVEWREAFAVWTEGLPLNPNRPKPVSGGMIDWEAILKDAPLNNTQLRATRDYDAIIAALQAANDCKRDDPAAYIVFDCAASKTRWYLTREGMPAHRAMALMYSQSHRGGEESLYSLGRWGGLLPAAQPPSATPAEKAAREEVINAWVRTLPGQETFEMAPPPLNFSLANTPFVDADFRERSPGYDEYMQKLTGGGCARKDVTEYIVFSCKGSQLLFVLSAPTAPAHPAMMVAELPPRAPEAQMLMSRYIFTRDKLPTAQTDETRAAHRKWSRGLEYLPAAQLR